MPIQSAGLLLYRRRAQEPEVLLIHMGGPIWARKDIAAWSIPKGVVGRGEDPLKAASREFREETGFVVSGTYEPLGDISAKQQQGSHCLVPGRRLRPGENGQQHTSKWFGRRNRERCRPFPKQIGQPGSTPMQRLRKLFAGSAQCCRPFTPAWAKARG